MNRTVFGLSLPAVAALASCVTGAAGSPRMSASPADSPPPGVDPARAYLALSEIEPPVQKPVHPDGIKPLSGRAAKQLTTARALAAEQRYTEAALELERAFRYDPNHPQIHRALALLHWEAGNAERTRIHAARALEVDPDDATAHYLIGRCQSLAEAWTSAITAYRTALLSSDFDRDPEIAALCHFRLAEALAAEGYLEASLEQFEAFEHLAGPLPWETAGDELRTLRQSTPGSGGEARSEVLETLERFAEAADALAPIVAAAPDNVARSARYARLLARSGQFDDALRAVRAIPSDDDTVIQLLFEIHERAGHPERVVDDLRRRIAERPDMPQLVLNLADAFTRLGRAAEAEQELRRYLDRHPDRHSVRVRLVDLLINQRAWTDALRVAAEGIRQRPDRAADVEAPLFIVAEHNEALAQLLGPPQPQDDYASTYLRGIVAAKAERLGKAEVLLRDSLAKEAAFIPARVALAQVYLRGYRYDDAIQIAARADEGLAEDGRLERVLGQVYARLDDLDRAQLHFKAAIQLNRADTQAMFDLADVYRRSGQKLRAQRQLRALLDQQPLHEEARESLAFMYLEERQANEASAELRKLKELTTSATTRARAQALLDHFERQDPGAYRQDLIEAMEQSRPDAATWLAVAQSYNEFAESAEAAEAYRRVLALDPRNEVAALGLAQIDQKMLAFEESAGRLEELLRRYPNRHAWRIGARDLLGLLELYSAIRDYDAALALARDQQLREDLDDSVRTAYRLWMIDTLRSTDRGDEAITLIRQWADVNADQLMWRDRLAQEYMRQGRAAEAVPIYEAAHRANPDESDSLNNLIDALLTAGLHDRAVQHALDRFYDDPEADQTLVVLTYVLARARRVDDALELIRNRLLTTLDRQYFQNLRIAHLRQAERNEDCLELIEHLLDVALTLMESAHGAVDPGQRRMQTAEQIASQPDAPFSVEGLHLRITELRAELARAYLETGKYRDVEELLRSWLELSQDPRIRFQFLRILAICYQAQGHDDQAAEALERALLFVPDDPGLNNDLAYTWIDRGVRLDEAEQMIRYAVWRSPREGAYLDTYGWFLYKRGDLARAKEWLLRASRSGVGGDPVVLDHLGDVCWRLGNAEEAIAHWVAAVEAVGGLGEDELIGNDVRRVRTATQRKIETAHAGKTPEIAPLAAPPPAENPDAGTEPAKRL